MRPQQVLDPFSLLPSVRGCRFAVSTADVLGRRLGASTELVEGVADTNKNGVMAFIIAASTDGEDAQVMEKVRAGTGD